jgi:coenzyme F420-0:L-glutamate ligase/coenzyme F420-1:gamma-L-glutamate ligase
LTDDTEVDRHVKGLASEGHAAMNDEIRIIPLRGIPEVRPGDDLVSLIGNALDERDLRLQDGDVLVIAQKVVSKAEGHLVQLSDVAPSALAETFARAYDKDPRHVEVVLREARRVVRMERGVLIVETKHGLVCANAGVDASNVDGVEVLSLLPPDPDASARRIRDGLEQRTGIAPAVIISDTFGRPWREGQTNIAIGVAGMLPLRDYTGQTDDYGYELRVTALCVADELAGAAELVQGKVDRVPVALIRGAAYERGEAGAAAIVRPPERDLFR